MVPMPYLQGRLLADRSVAPRPHFNGNPTLGLKLSQFSETASVGNIRYEGLQAIFQKQVRTESVWLAFIPYRINWWHRECAYYMDFAEPIA